MKKIFTLLLLVFVVVSLSSCNGTSDFYYSLKGNINSYEYEGKTFLQFRVFMNRGVNKTGVGFSEKDDGSFSYEGESIYKYKVLVESNFKYEFTGKKHHYELKLELDIK